MEYRIESLASLTFLGVQDVVRREPDFFQKLWRERFSPREADIRPLSLDCAYYGVTYATEDDVYYLAGVVISPDAEVPEGLAVASVPAATYVVTPCGISEIGRAYHKIYHDILPDLGMEDDLHAADFERYPADWDGSTPIEVWVSARRKEGVGH